MSRAFIYLPDVRTSWPEKEDPLIIKIGHETEKGDVVDATIIILNNPSQLVVDATGKKKE